MGSAAHLLAMRAASRRRTVLGKRRPDPVHPVLRLQTLAGNAAVSGLLTGRGAGHGVAQPLGSQPVVHRQPTAPAPPAPPRGSPGPSSSGRSSGSPGLSGGLEVVELKGKPRFQPSQHLTDEITAGSPQPLPLPVPFPPASEGVMVNVRFGDLAEGQIPVLWNAGGFQTPPPQPRFPAWGIPLHHPALPSAALAEPMLWIVVRDSRIFGGLGWKSLGGLAADPSKFRKRVPREALFGGMSGITNLKFPGDIHEGLSNGRLIYDVPHLTFDVGPFSGSGRLRIDDAAYDFEAAIDVPMTGLPSAAKVPIKRTPSGINNYVIGRQTWSYERTLGGRKGGRISGDVTATLGNGSFDVRGSARYSNTQPRVNGTVTIIIDSFDKAKKAVQDHLGPDAPGAIDPAAAGEGIAVTGWGQLSFALSAWMTGNAEVIVHPEGWVTARGELLPTKIIPLVRKRQKERELFKESVDRWIVEVPGIGDIRIEGDAKLLAYGRFGPGTLHGIRLEGLLSNHPAILNRFEVAGTISAPAAAGLRLNASLGLSAKLAHLAEMAHMKIRGQGILELQMYAEAAAAAGRRPSKADPTEPEYFVQGHLEAASALNFDLQLRLSGSVIFLRGKIDLVDQTWTLGSAGARMGFDYVLGDSKQSKIDTSFDSISFDAGKFAEDVVRGQTVEAKGYEGKQAVDAKAASDVVNPNAPVPQGPPQAGPATPGTPLGTAPDKVLEESFDMLNEPHTLRLALLDTPELEMASRTPRSLLGKIKSARAAVRKDPILVAAMKGVRLADLDKIEDQAKQVLGAAAKVAKAAPYLSPSVSGFADLAKLITGYATRYDVTDLASGLAAVSVDPTKPETVLNKFPSLAADTLITARVARIIESGTDAVKLRKIVDNHRPSAEDSLVELLEQVETMLVTGATGAQSVIADLAIGGNKMKGAAFVLRYVHTYPPGWGDVAFEAKDEDAGQPDSRRWDAWIAGSLYEFKSWYSWKPVASYTFLKQMLQDYEKTRVGQSIGLRWVFADSPMSRDHILEQMTAALDGVKADLLAGKAPKVGGYTVSICDFIKSRIGSVVLKIKP